MKARAAVDAGTGHAVHAAFTPVSTHDICELHGLVRDSDTVVFADSGYRGCTNLLSCARASRRGVLAV